MLKVPFERVKEMANGMVHLDPWPGADAVTLCGITDWLGQQRGQPTMAPVTCIPCRATADYCQSHRKLVKPKAKRNAVRCDG